MSDGIIDLGEYARRKEEEARPERTVFAIWGGEGERTRFALPLWRAAGLSGGDRALIGREPVDGPDGSLEPLVVLDLASDPARIEVAGDTVEGLRKVAEAPAVARTPEALVVFLGTDEEHRYYLVVDHVSEGAGEGPVPIDELYFLAGECAGLLFHRALAYDEDP